MNDDPPYGGRRFLVDLSAFSRCRRDAVRFEWEAAVRGDHIVVCTPFLMEALYTARNERELVALAEDLTEGFQHVLPRGSSWRLALTAQRRLASRGATYHRINPVDLLIGAVAHENGLGVLHYDHHYDDIAAYGGLEFESRWIAPPGTLDDILPNPLAPYKRGLAERLAQLPTTETYKQLIAVLDREIELAGLPPAAPVP